MATKPNNDEISKPSDFIRDAVSRFEDGEAAKSTLMRRAKEDFKFALVPGHQWDQHLTSKRRKRPCYEFNRLRQMIRRVTGQQLQNRPQIKVRPAEDGDRETAEILNGLIRNIEASSDAKIAYDNAFTWACAGGIGAWEVTSDYDDENGFDKCIRIEMIDDPERITWDPAARDIFRRDARYCFVSNLIPKELFKKLYPGKKIVDFEGTSESKWWYKDQVRIAKYWFKESEKRVIYRLNDGTIVDAIEFDPIAKEAESAGITIAEVREIDRDIVKCCLISGADRLTEPVEWPGKHIPIVMNWGELVTVDGEQYYCGMTRFGRDAQMIHNFELSTLIEVVAKMPNSPLTATPKMIEGLKSYYERLGYDDPPVLLYNVDPSAPQARPTREPPAQFPAAFASVSAIAIDEIKATTGIYDASLGARSNETSGRAILARQQEADVSNYVFIDNHLKALKFTGEILVDIIPKVYDATRTIRILGEDGAEKFVKINRPIRDIETGEVKIINDLSRGKYDVVVSTGKSFETQRMEVAEIAEALSRAPGPLGMIGQYLLVKNLDAPGLDELLTAVRRILVQQGLLEPGENDPPPQPPQPNPKDIADAELKSAQAQKTLAQTQQILATTPSQAAKGELEAAASLAQLMGSMPQQMPVIDPTLAGGF
jgi:hypothetical protein